MTQAEVYNYLRETGRCLSVKEIAKALNKSRSSVTACVNRLKRAGFIEEVIVKELRLYENSRGSEVVVTFDVSYYRVRD